MIPPRIRRARNTFGQHRVQFHGTNLTVTVTKRAAEVDRWVNEIIHNHRAILHRLIIGLDIEWHPCLPTEENPVATLQLCVGNRCLIFLLLHRDYIPRSLMDFLSHPLFTFVGVGVQDDAEKLFRDHGLVVGNVVDLRCLAARGYGSGHFMWIGLKKMAKHVLGMVMEKPQEVTLSKWDAKSLTFGQIEYGSIDAFVSFKLGINLFALNQRLKSFPLEPPPLRLESFPLKPPPLGLKSFPLEPPPLGAMAY